MRFSAMRFDVTICALFGLAAMAGAAQAQPGGSYLQTCRNIQISGSALTAECRDVSGHYQLSSTDVNCRGDIGNNNGSLFCNTGRFGGAPVGAVSGSFERTCRNIRVSGSSLTAECRDPSGHYHSSRLAYVQCNGDIGNNNGELFCNGPMGGGYQNRPYDNSGYGGRDDRDNRYGGQGRNR